MAKWLTKRNILIALIVGAVVLALIFIVPVSIPIILALLTAMAIEPLVSWAERKLSIPRKGAVISVYIFVLSFIIAVIYFSMTTLIGKIVHFFKEAPSHLNTLTTIWNDTQAQLFKFTASLPDEFVTALQVELNNIILSFRDSLVQLFSYDKISAFAASLPNFFVSLIVYLIALFLFMLELPHLKEMVFRHLKESTAHRVRYMTARLTTVLKGFFKAQIFVSLIIFAVAFIGLLLIVPEYAVVMSIVIWIIDIIPILGSIIVLAPWAFYAFVTGDASLGTQLSILAVLLLVIRRTVEPKVMGSQIGLSPLPTLIAMFIGLKLFGFLGFFIGPLVVIMFTTAREAGFFKLDFKI